MKPLIAIALCLPLPAQVVIDSLARDVMSWLPSDTRAILVTSEPIRIADKGAVVSYRSYAQVTVGVVSAAATDEPVFRDILTSRSIYAGWGYAGLSGDGSDDCNVLQLDGVTAAGVEEALRPDGVNEPKNNTRLYRSGRTFIAMLPGDILLACTREARLQALLNRRTMRAERVAFPETLPEWANVDVTAPIWGITHFGAFNSSDAVGLTTTMRPGLGKLATVAAGPTDLSDIWKGARVRVFSPDNRTVAAEFNPDQADIFERWRRVVTGTR